MFEAEVLAAWRTQLEAMALTHNANADVYFKNACDSWKEDNLWRVAQGLKLTVNPEHLPVCSVGSDEYGYPVLVWTESTAECPDLPTIDQAPSGNIRIGSLFGDNSGRRYAELGDTVTAGTIVNSPDDGLPYVKVIIQTPFGPAKWYAPKV